jgi:hypothetical protein
MGTAIFYAAYNMGGRELEGLFQDGVALIDQSASGIGSGQFHDLAIDTNSDPADAIRYVPTSGPFGVTAESRAARRRLEDVSNQEFCSFRDLSRYYSATGRELIRYAERQVGGNRIIEASVGSIVCNRTDRTFTSVDGLGRLIIRSNELVLATGGAEKIHDDLKAFDNQVITSRDVLIEDKQRVRTALARAKENGQKTIAILGSGNSAIGAIGELTKLEETQGFDIVVAYRSRFYLNYVSLEAAHNDGYIPGPEELSNEPPYPVNRVRGLRGASQKILKDALSSKFGSISFIEFDGKLQNLELLKRAGVIIQALGYQNATPQLIDAQGQEILLQIEEGRIVVDEQDQIITKNGTPIERAYRVGLGALKATGWEVPGFVAEAALTKGPIDGVKAFQGPGGSGEQLAIRLLG